MAALCVAQEVVTAHPGGLNADGCHNNRNTGDYHCHAAASKSAAPKPPSASSSQRRNVAPQGAAAATPRADGRTPTCYVGPRGGTYTITASGGKNYSGC